MNRLVLALVALTSCVTAIEEATPRIDLYRNILTSSNERIIGGESAERYQFPHQASLQWGISGIYAHICGAVPISENWALTAAHCKAYPIGSYRLILGLLNQGEAGEDVQQIKVEEFIVHSDYPGGVAANDIALLKLESRIVESKAVQIAKLPTDEQCASLEDAILTGWGLTSIIPIPPVGLRYAKLPRLSLEDCKNALIALMGDSGPLDETQICTGAQEGTRQSACSGDSGGPLITTAAETTTIVGIVSWGLAPCGIPGAPSVYTNVCSHREFIDSTISG